MVRVNEETSKNGESKKVEYVITQEFEYHCLYCDAKGERYDQVFDHGTCGNCGAAAGEKLEVVSSRPIENPEQTALIIYGSDGEAAARDIMKEAEAVGVPTIDYKDYVTNGMSSEQKNKLALELARKCGRTFICVSEQLTMEQGKLAKSAFEANDYLPDRAVKAIPVLVNRQSARYLPHDRDGLQCMTWSEEASQGITDSGRKIWASPRRMLGKALEMFREQTSN